jgi:NADPH:quinone reductase-like Zn-dependent oxidoreductase
METSIRDGGAVTEEKSNGMWGLQIEGALTLEELAQRELPLPRRGEGDAVVKVAAAAVNRSDVLNVIGMMPITRYPRVPGRDFAGTVVEGPADLVGTQVWGTGGNELGFSRDGSHAEFLSLSADALVPLPSTLSLEEAGAAGLSYQIACDGLLKAGLLAEGGSRRVLVTGAAGGVGSAVAAVATWRGAQLFAAVLDDEEREDVLAAHPSATVVVTSKERLSQRIGELTDGAGVDIIFDTVGNPLFAEAIGCLAIGGRMVIITAAPGATVPLDLFAFYRSAAALITANSGRGDSAWAAAVLRDLLPGFESGELRPPRIAKRFSLAEAASAYAATMNGTRGRVVLVPGRADG